METSALFTFPPDEDGGDDDDDDDDGDEKKKKKNVYTGQLRTDSIRPLPLPRLSNPLQLPR